MNKLLGAKETLRSGIDFGKSDFTKAIEKFEASRDQFAELGDVAEAAMAENWAAQYLPDVGRIADGRMRLSSQISVTEKRKFNTLQSPAYYWLGISDFVQNRFSESNKNLKTALKIAEAGNNIFEAHHNAEALVLNYTLLSELDTALSYASTMVSFKASYFENEGQSSRDLGTLARLCGQLNFPATALGLSKERLTIVKENVGNDPASQAYSSRLNDALAVVISAAVGKRDFADALKYAEESKQVALNRADSSERTRTLAEIYLAVADARSQMKDYNQAIADYDQALKLFNDLPEVTFYLYRIHKGKLFCFHALRRQEDFDRELKAVLKLSEEYRKRIREDNSRQAFFANEQVVFDVAAANALETSDSRRAFDLVEESRARSLLDFVESDQPIAQVEKGFAGVARPLTLSEIQTRLPDQVQVVQYAVLPDKLVIWLLSKSRFEYSERPITAAELDQKVSNYRSALISRSSPGEVTQAGKELYELLLPANLDFNKQLCLIPDKSLHQLPFASLVSPEGKYLLQNFAVFYSPSASLLVLASESARHKSGLAETLLSVGNPEFDRQENPKVSDLPTAAAEAKEIAGQYKQPLVLLGSDATKDRFLQNMQTVEVIHFAGHFLANHDSVANSKFLFANGELRASELSSYKLPRGKLVVLSACETGYERYDRSEGAIGIARTFLALGVPAVIASEWKVDSEPTKDLMIALHRNRKEKQLPTAESLRAAQLEILSRKETKDPFYWAAFSLFGGYANY